jgi:ubiquinone/menaquinone biosynthesis C-methylase UbiE
VIKRIYKKILRKLGYKPITQSETSKVRHLVINYCKGYGCDLGFGGDKIQKNNCDGIDYAVPYTKTGKDKVDIACNLFEEAIPVKDNTYDYVYSSHLIEDFKDTTAILTEFIRILKSGGDLVLVFPDQPKYAKHCIDTGQPVNQYHVHENMGLNFMYECLNKIDSVNYQILFESNCDIDYNVVMVLKIHKL